MYMYSYREREFIRITSENSEEPAKRRETPDLPLVLAMILMYIGYIGYMYVYVCMCVLRIGQGNCAKQSKRDE